jgi:solute carrier family 25 phosphate transporter 23/24/25/41
MDFETKSQKKKSGVFGDVYGGITMVLPKEIM